MGIISGDMWKGNGGRYEAAAAAAAEDPLEGGGRSVGGVGGNVGCWGDELGAEMVCGGIPFEEDSLGGVKVGDAEEEKERTGGLMNCSDWCKRAGIKGELAGWQS